MPLVTNISADVTPVRILVVGERASLFRELCEASRAPGAHHAEVRFVDAGAAQWPAGWEPDVVVIDAGHERTILRQINAVLGAYPNAKCVVVTPHDDEAWLQRIVALGVHYCMLRPLDPATMLRRLVQTAQPDRHGKYSLKAQQRLARTEARVGALLSELGMPAHYHGYAYLRVAIALAVHDEMCLNRLTSYLYPAVARRFGVRPAHVERSIRHAIEVTWMRGNLERIDELFAYSVDQEKGKPTNGLFIARLADHLRLAEQG